jgi:hypothetical protein
MLRSKLVRTALLAVLACVIAVPLSASALTQSAGGSPTSATAKKAKKAKKAKVRKTTKVRVVVGPKGDKGDAGAAGAAGAAGLQGIQGETGAQGAAGVAGLKGETGANGLKGDAGAKGIKGDTGAAGAQGIQGDAGPTGATGATGANFYEVATMPSGKTQVGAWDVEGTSATTGPFQGGMSWNVPITPGTGIQLKYVATGATAPAECTVGGVAGTLDNPKAQPGWACVFASAQAANLTYATYWGIGNGKFGAILGFNQTASGFAFANGSYAVTAP